MERIQEHTTCWNRSLSQSRHSSLSHPPPPSRTTTKRCLPTFPPRHWASPTRQMTPPHSQKPNTWYQTPATPRIPMISLHRAGHYRHTLQKCRKMRRRTSESSRSVSGSGSWRRRDAWRRDGSIAMLVCWNLRDPGRAIKSSQARRHLQGRATKAGVEIYPAMKALSLIGLLEIWR